MKEDVTFFKSLNKILQRLLANYEKRLKTRYTSSDAGHAEAVIDCTLRVPKPDEAARRASAQ